MISLWVGVMLGMLPLLVACRDRPTAPPTPLPAVYSDHGVVVELPGGVPLEFVKIDAGGFLMGTSPD